MTGRDERFARARVRHEAVRRSLQVIRTSHVAPGIRRITLGGAELPGFTSLGPADHVKVFVPAADGDLVSRDYTPVAYRGSGDGVAPGGELDLDFYLHGVGSDAGGDGGSGPAASWAVTAAPGDAVAIGGPRGSKLPPADADALLLVADETALPAVTRWLAALPDVPVVGLFAVTDPGISAYLAPHVAAHRDFRWFSGGTRHDRVAEALRALTIGAGTFCFLAGESRSLVPLRRYLRRELGLPKAQVDAHGYWKLGTAGHDHHAPIDPSDDD